MIAARVVDGKTSSALGAGGGEADGRGRWARLRHADIVSMATARHSGYRDLRIGSTDKRVITTAGVDEAGRGPLAGPVVAAAVIMDPRQPIAGIGDSKTLSASRRERLAAEIIEHAAGWALGEATVEEIDEFNILGATLLAMKRAVAALTPVPELVLVDGPHCPPLKCATRGIIKGDASITSIGAASILAKVNRDAQMVDLARHYPGYGFERHKGYPTREHLRALAHQGVSPQHRRSFRPVKQYLETLGTQR